MVATCWVAAVGWALIISGDRPSRQVWEIDGWPRLHRCYTSKEACDAAALDFNLAFDIDNSSRHAECEHRPPKSN